MDDADWDTHTGTTTATATTTSNDIPHSHTHWERLTTTYADAGYREGITPGKLSTLQRGFDEAFAASVVPSRRLGQVQTQDQNQNDLLPASTAPTNAKQPPTLLFHAKETRRHLSRIPRDHVLPVDEEALAHAAAEHPDEQPLEQQRRRQHQQQVAAAAAPGEAWTQQGQEVRERREMERLLNGMEDLSASATGLNGGTGHKHEEGMREHQLLDLWEARVAQLEREAGL
ncbi:hypothetical protein QFC24_000387 [Naganishia onofrii]|uniref:Uncharacterized protein n=1 Tax=Naganishia onofrii TaxID=1851511 RepID=A0ACC2XXV8_9TREE|nr:hypothetical protein QFC24_000387 [Naganishia onofrii]